VSANNPSSFLNNSPLGGHDFPFFQQKHAVLEIGSPKKPTYGTIGPDNAMAWDQDGERIPGKGGTHKTTGPRMSDLCSYLAVSSDLSVRNGCDSFQHRALQGRHPT